MKNSKLKDKVLLTLGRPDNYLSRIELMPDVSKEEALIVIHELIADGHIELTYEAMNDNPVVELTAKGALFMRNGGYKQQKREATLKKIWKCILFLLGTFSGIALEECARHLLKNVF